MKSIIELSIYQFSAVYLLLLVVLGIMRWCSIDKSKLLVVASVRMTVQLVIAGLVLTYIFKEPCWWYTAAYLLLMIVFACHRVISKNPWLNKAFRAIVCLSLTGCALSVMAFFVTAVVRVDLFNPQYAIPLGGMIIGNAMTGLNLGLKSFSDSLTSEHTRAETLLNFGVAPRAILLPFANNALETAIFPTLNSMIGMGIVALPGMMTGQILSGTLPSTAILYQIAIMISICTVVCSAVFCALYYGCRTLYNSRDQLELPF